MRRTRNKDWEPRGRNLRDQRSLFLIVAEGETERSYFRMLKETCSHVDMKLPSPKHSSPGALLKCAGQHAAAAWNRTEQQVWLVFDADVSERHGNLDEEVRQAKKQGFACAVTNPCFEYWLILHHQDCRTPFASSEKCLEYLKGVQPDYEKGKEKAVKTYTERARLESAANRAASVMKWHRDMDRKEDYPLPCSTLYELMREIWKDSTKETAKNPSAQKQE